jgi:small-conductance mechanosensitive channel
MKKNICLAAMALFAVTGAFASTGDPEARTGISQNKMEIWQQEEQNAELQDNIDYQQQELYRLMQDKESIRDHLHMLQAKQQRALSRGRNAKADRIARRISWDQAFIQADEENMRGNLAVERADMRIMNHNVDRMAEEHDAIKKGRGI